MNSIASCTPDTTEAVILLHGLARTRWSMKIAERFLRKKGYVAVNMGYPSRKKNIETLSNTVISKAILNCRNQGAETIHFVTHSMGGILVRHFLEHQDITGLGRVVMLSPPNHGSEVVDRLKHLKLFKWMNGPAGQELGTDEKSVPSQLPEPGFDLGIITGDRSVNPLLSHLIPGKNDGKVSVESARLKKIKDFLVVHRAHSFIMNDPKVLEQAHRFLCTGRFNLRTPIC